MTFREKSLWVISRIIPSAIIVPEMQTNLFAPFIGQIDINIFDPWGSWITSGGRSDAFPYGPFMFLIFAIVHFILEFSGSWIERYDPVTLSSILITVILLLIDYVATREILARAAAKKTIRKVVLYSPILLYVTYIHGQNDIVPAVLLFVMATHILSNNWGRAGIFLALGICSKFALLLAVPFILIYFINTNKISSFKIFVKPFFFIACLSLLPLLWSSGYREMVLQSPEFANTLNFSLPLGNLDVYLLPIGYIAALLSFWSVARCTPMILVVYISLSFILVATLQTRSVGWYLWGYLISLFLIGKLRPRLVILFIFWQFAAIGLFLYRSESINFRIFATLEWNANSQISSLLFTFELAISFILILKVITEVKIQFDPYFLEKKPLAIAIAGDSGVGKDTLCKAIGEVMNDEQISYLLGDDYHYGERKSLTWKSKTHLNSSANDLSRWNRDVRLAIKRTTVIARQYDHLNGKFTPDREILPGDFVLLNGLHSLLLPEVLDFDLKVFLSMNESLRVQLKLDRDATERGQVDKKVILKNIDNRLVDAKKYINVQMDLADCLIETTTKLKGNLDSIRYRVRLKEDSLLHEICAALQSLEPLLAQIETMNSGTQILVLDPQYYTEKYHEIFIKKLLPNLDCLLVNPSFLIHPGSLIAALVLVVAARKRELSSA